jgi:hypothetical protein
MSDDHIDASRYITYIIPKGIRLRAVEWVTPESEEHKTFLTLANFVPSSVDDYWVRYEEVGNEEYILR